ncbi:hypothetical protein NX059_006838 [Plenodomus lindquistii]|nr:hypothetical protein NX059_006838 [Plenodomus lindquistii]
MEARQSPDGIRPPLRPLLPAAAPRADMPPLQSKRARVSLACAACRTRKTKCDGERPKCSECTSRDSDCRYTETESTQTKRRHADIEELFELLRTLPEEDAFELLARIRAGTDTRDLVETIQHGNLLVQFASASAAGSQDSQELQRSAGDPSTRESSMPAKPRP